MANNADIGVEPRKQRMLLLITPSSGLEAFIHDRDCKSPALPRKMRSLLIRTHGAWQCQHNNATLSQANAQWPRHAEVEAL
jgi:hypothetical protein